MAALGCRGVGFEAQLRKIDITSGEVEVLGDYGQWVIERRGADA